jgi:hypothetical protein
MGPAQHVFDRKIVRRHRDRAARHFADHDFLFREAAERYGDTAGEMTVCKVIEDDAGVELRVPGDWTPPWELDFCRQIV